MDAIADWAEEVFGDAELGDIRRTRRLVGMSTAAGRRPSGRLSDVYDSAAERQGAKAALSRGNFESRRVTDGKPMAVRHEGAEGKQKC